MNFRTRIHKSASNLVLDQSFEQRQWLKKRGKSHRLTFSQDMIDKLKKYFVSLDEDSNQMISAAELEDPLILFGLCKNKIEVAELFKLVDFDGSGEIEFREFLEVFRRVQNDSKQQRICRQSNESKKYEQFTKALLGMQNKLDSDISFRLGMSIYRRKNIIRAIVSKNPKEKQHGRGIMAKFQEQIQSDPKLRDRLRTEKDEDFQFLPQLPTRRQPIDSYHRRVQTQS